MEKTYYLQDQFCKIHMIIMDFHMTIQQIHMNIMQIQYTCVLWSNLQPHAGSNNLLHLFSAAECP